MIKGCVMRNLNRSIWDSVRKDIIDVFKVMMKRKMEKKVADCCGRKGLCIVNMY